MSRFAKCVTVVFVVPALFLCYLRYVRFCRCVCFYNLCFSTQQNTGGLCPKKEDILIYLMLLTM